MNRHVACTLAALMALARPGLSGYTDPTPAQLEILVDGVPQTRYAFGGRWYIEALKGREYAIRLRNPYPVRVAVALSVDGLNTIDARETTAAAGRKWVLGAYDTVVIPGWQTSGTHARAFEFTSEARSYGQALGKTANLGVISAVFFREQPTHVAQAPEREQSRRAAPAAAAPSGAARQDSAAEHSEYAATGMGRRTGHAVEQVRLDLEETPAASVTIRYEFRPHLVRLGNLPTPGLPETLRRREGARGFEPGFAPEIETLR